MPPTLEIIIDHGGRVEASQKKQRKNSGTARKADDVIGRRRLQKGIHFYDLGQVNVGPTASVGDRRIDDTWADVDFDYTPPVSTFVPLPPTYSMPGYVTLRDTIFSIPSDQWATMYRKLSFEQAERYGLDVINPITHQAWPIARNGSRYMYSNTSLNVVVHDTKWTNKGWIKPASGFDTWWMTAFGGAFEFLTNDANCYVTTIQDPSAGHVAFTLDQNADVFLMPQIVFGYRDNINPATLPFPSRQVIVGPQTTMKRAVFLFPSHLTSGYPALHFDTPSNDPQIHVAAYGTTLSNIIQFEMMEQNAFEFQENSVGGGSSGGTTGTYPKFGGTSSSQIQNFIDPGSPTTVTHDTGDFVGAIKQNGTMYYFWTSDSYKLNIPATIRPVKGTVASPWP